jgi:PleD family two-component response regulator
MFGEYNQVMILDRNQSFLQLVAPAAEDHFRFQYASSLETALEQLSTNHFEALVVDISPDEGFGLEALQVIHQQAPQVAVITLTSKEAQDLGIQSVRLGAQDSLVKSQVTAQLLNRAVRYAIERQQMVIALRQLAMVDEQTRLYNRQGLEALAEQHLRLALRRTSELALTVITVPASSYATLPQELMEHLADILRHTFRASDILARFNARTLVVLALDVPAWNIGRLEARLRENLTISAARGEISETIITSTHTDVIKLEEGFSADKLIDEIDRLRKLAG